MSDTIQQISENKIVVHGDLIFNTVGAIYEQNKDLITSNGSEIEISLAGVMRADSSGLALIIEWSRVASAMNRPLKFTHVPQQILDLAKLSSLEELFNLK